VKKQHLYSDDAELGKEAFLDIGLDFTKKNDLTQKF